MATSPLLIAVSVIKLSWMIIARAGLAPHKTIPKNKTKKDFKKWLILLANCPELPGLPACRSRSRRKKADVLNSPTVSVALNVLQP
jgi:hypothetical protein